MRSSTILTFVGATIAVASPIHQALHKKAIVWDIVTDIVYVTVTKGDLPTTPSTPPATVVTIQETHWVNPVEAVSTTPVVIPTSTVAPPPPPPATTSTPPPAPPSTTSIAPAPAPTTPEAAVFVATTPVVAATPEVEPASSAAAVAPVASPSDLISNGLYHHNAHRSNHSASALSWDQDLADYAQILADTCNYGHDQSIGGGGYGQNIDAQGYGDSTSNGAAQQDAEVAAWDPSVVLGSSITNDWYLSEYGIFDGQNEDRKVLYGVASPSDYSPSWTHFSQIVWKSTTKVGCAVKYCGSGKMLGNAYSWYTVCNYGPVGNVLGEFASDVTQSLGLAGIAAPHPYS